MARKPEKNLRARAAIVVLLVAISALPAASAEQLSSEARELISVFPGLGNGLLLGDESGSGGSCGIGASEGLVHRTTIRPYGSGWYDQHGNSVYQVIRVCESTFVGPTGERYVFWAVEQTLNAASGWYARHICCHYTAWYDVAAGDATTIETIDPVNTAGSGCGESHPFSLSVAAGPYSASASWSHELCKISTTKHTYNDKVVRWFSEREHDALQSPTYVMGFVTSTPAGSAATVTIHDVQRFCKNTCGQNSRIEGGYSMGITTTPLVPEGEANVMLRAPLAGS